MSTGPTPEQLTPRQRATILFIASFGGFVVTLTSSGINIGLPTIGEAFGVSAVYLNWISLSMILVSAAALLPSGRLADTYGRMRFWLAGVILFSLVSFASALAPSAEVLLVLRAFSGISLAVGSVTSTALVILAYPIETRGRALGWCVLGIYLGVTLGPALGGLIFESLGWRAFFYILGAVNLVNVVLPLWKLRGIEWRDTKKGSFDLPGTALYAIGLVVLLLGFTRLPGLAGVALFVGGLLVLAGFLWWEARAADPLLPVSLLRHNRVFAFSNGAVFVNYAATAAMSLLMSYYLLIVRGLDKRTAGLVVAAGSLVQALASPVAGRAADRLTARYVASGGMLLCMLALVGLVFLGPATPYWYVVTVLCVMGLGMAFFSTPITYAIMGSVDKSRVGAASATLAAVRQAGMNLSLGVATMLMTIFVGSQRIEEANFPRLHDPLLRTVHWGFVIFAALCAAGIAASWVGLRRVRQAP